MSQIKFGTDGWRAVIGDDFIPKNVEKVIQAFCDWRSQVDPGRKKVVLGYDRRFQSPETARLVAEVLAGNGFSVQLSDHFCPTPCISWMVKNSDAFAGVMVTASHNPANWNGIKFKEEYGGSASPEYTQYIEAQCQKNSQSGVIPKKISFEEGKAQGLISLFSPENDYVLHLRNLLKGDIIRAANWKILYDPLFGAGTGYVGAVLDQDVHEIHNEADPTFGGLNPEPIDKNLSLLMKKVPQEGYDVGLATDGDADRIGAVDEKGNFVNPHQIYALLLKHYVEDRGLKGTIIKSISTTQMINALGEKYGLEVIETPIGFKHICQKLVETDALMGGEESGGISFAPHVHERDGVLNGLMLLEMMSQRKKRLGELLEELYADIGRYYFTRVDLHLELPKIAAMRERLSKQKVNTIASLKVTGTNFVDGFKYIFEDGSWLLMRASGTEPLVRIYAESLKEPTVRMLIEAGVKMVS